MEKLEIQYLDYNKLVMHLQAVILHWSFLDELELVILVNYPFVFILLLYFKTSNSHF